MIETFIEPSFVGIPIDDSILTIALRDRKIEKQISPVKLPRDGDSDGYIYDGTDREQRAPKKKPQEKIAAKQTDSPEFKKWFGDSKVVDEDGAPLVVYHGSGEENIEVFKPSLAGTVQYLDWGPGVYFTPSKAAAESYRTQANQNADEEGDKLWQEMNDKSKEFGTSVMYWDIHLRSGKISESQYQELNEIEKRWRQARNKVDEDKNSGHVYSVYLKIENPLHYTYVGITDPYMSAIAQAEGHDGIIIKNEDGIWEEIIVFHPSQIKSATGNRGTFDPDNPDIRKSLLLSWKHLGPGDHPSGSPQSVHGGSKKKPATEVDFILNYVKDDYDKIVRRSPHKEEAKAFVRESEKNVKEIVSNMGSRAKGFAKRGLSDIKMYESPVDVFYSMSKSNQDWTYDNFGDEAQTIVGGYYEKRTGVLHVDGMDVSGFTHAGIFAHELAHAVDHGSLPEGRKLSSLPEWIKAWWEEINTDDLIPPLSLYAKQDVTEGFAEFARLAWTDPEAMRFFPLAKKFFEEHGLIQ